MIERKKRENVKAFKQCGLFVTIERNLKTVDCLDITFDLQKSVHKPH